VIFPELHYGRDSIVGIALVLNELADYNGKVSDYKISLPQYFISKTKIENINSPDRVLKSIENKYSKNTNVKKVWTNDGVKIDFENFWVHMRKSNTEPIIRIITEAKSKKEAEENQKFFLKMIRSESALLNKSS
jgi:phosphomannomutase